MIYYNGKDALTPERQREYAIAASLYVHELPSGIKVVRNRGAATRNIAFPVQTHHSRHQNCRNCGSNSMELKCEYCGTYRDRS